MGDRAASPDGDSSAVEELVPLIRDRFERIVERIEGAGGVIAGGGRDGPADSGGVRVMAVTKGHTAEVAAASLRAGAHLLGESYAQELVRKAPLVEGAEWHFIGQLQTNKVRAVAPVVSVVESVDRRSLVDELARRSPGHQVFIEVDLARAAGLDVAGRGGIAIELADSLIDDAVDAGLSVTGVMGVAPYSADGRPDGTTVARAFRALRGLADRRSLAECSMGMSDDLEIAVSEGSTLIRVGTALFGPRTVQAR